jgi:hypothetical protein
LRGLRIRAVLQIRSEEGAAMKTLLLSILALGVCCCLFSNSAVAQKKNAPKAAPAPQTDSWPNVPANCQGVQNTGQHICQFVRTQVRIGADANPFDQWNLVAVEPGTVTGVSCQTAGTNIFEYGGSNGPKRNPFPGDHYGNVGICRGWINGGIGPVSMSVTYSK